MPVTLGPGSRGMRGRGINHGAISMVVEGTPDNTQGDWYRNYFNKGQLDLAQARDARSQQAFDLLRNGSLLQNALTAGGQSGPSPEITVGGVLNPQQIQQQVNAARAANDMATGSRITDTNRSLAGRGFGAGSPLAAALSTGMQNQNLATNTANEREIRLGGAQMNSGQLLRSQMAREEQFGRRQQEDIERRRPYFQTQASLLAALAGMV